MSSSDVVNKESGKRKTNEVNQPPAKVGANDDVVVVVGGQEFQECSHHLRYCSSYFNGAFRSGMKETQTMRFEFPDGDPESWKLTMSLLSPLSKQTITSSNIEKVLPWFDELCVSVGLKRCEDFVLGQITPADKLHDEYGLGDMNKAFHSAMKWLPLALQYNLQNVKRRCFEVLRKSWEAKHRWYLIDGPTFDTLKELLESHDEHKQDLWDLLAVVLPNTIADKKEQDFLLSSGILRMLFVSELQRQKTLLILNNCAGSRPMWKVASQLKNHGVTGLENW
ncbi:expressed unknown protein [Seminavis robusta]|uniref:BTB domain-containing protein n=1 Tax=Seminavis robusta TaxID=568900 RepID=A0A9N8F2X2_9STRA|nr:expressed unknown protein [Seminavis robusta]|eukprot:Sro2509_g329770.1 n/a (280) ;mRNA; r:4958-5797